VVKIILIGLFSSLSLCVQSETLTDPTAPLNFQPAKVAKLSKAPLPQLQSIVVKAGEQQAIINNKSYQEGQRVGGYLVTKIKRDKVLLKYKNKVYTLTLYSESERFSY